MTEVAGGRSDGRNVKKRGVVAISYAELQSSSPTPALVQKIGDAFGDGSAALGILAVTEVPPPYCGLRSKLLPLSKKVAELTPEAVERVVVKESKYQVGWSHGKERVEGGERDASKGSFYANPLTDDLLASLLTRDPLSSNDHLTKKLAAQNPAFFANNVWPNDTLPELEACVKQMGNLVRDVALLVARLCDAYVLQRCPGYTPGKVENVVATSLCCKARLLHYFPQESNTFLPSSAASKAKDANYSDWCGWHNDHGSLTGLVPAMYLNKHGLQELCPDPSAGLYVMSRCGEVIHVDLPPNTLAFQVGETTQIHTGGILQATPHAVKGFYSPRGDMVSRESFAVFLEPEYHDDMKIPNGKTVHDVQHPESEKSLPQSVRTLQSRWKEGMNFGEFSNATFAAFH